TIFSRARSSRCLSSSGSCSTLTVWSSTWISPAAVTVTFTPEGVASETAELGRSTSLPWLEITEGVTMKMISRTRKMSVSGVMLISATISSPPSSSPLGRERAAMPHLRGGLRARLDARGLDVQQRLHEALAGAREAGGHAAGADLQVVVGREREDRD